MSYTCLINNVFIVYYTKDKWPLAHHKPSVHNYVIIISLQFTAIQKQ